MNIIEHLKSMDAVALCALFVGAALGVAFLFLISFASSALCVAAGYGANICGM